jgi:hypothetical protein
MQRSIKVETERTLVGGDVRPMHACVGLRGLTGCGGAAGASGHVWKPRAPNIPSIIHIYILILS